MIVNNEHYQSGSSSTICLIDDMLECLCRFLRETIVKMFSQCGQLSLLLYIAD